MNNLCSPARGIVAGYPSSSVIINSSWPTPTPPAAAGQFMADESGYFSLSRSTASSTQCYSQPPIGQVSIHSHCLYSTHGYATQTYQLSCTLSLPTAYRIDRFEDMRSAAKA